MYLQGQDATQPKASPLYAQLDGLPPIRGKGVDLAGAELVEGDARDPAALTRAIAGCDAVVTSLGTAMSPFREVTLLSTATRALFGVMEQQNTRRLVCITGLGAGDSGGHGGFFFDRLFLP
ncbi:MULTISPECIES: NAD(P)H-binding protein [Rhizobium]|uniref:NAD(P)H-binding protein n=1 Tax=Rhizobium TaxID=379 RepID=UPI002484335A|nr:MULTISPECIES: NAD(P)H-binding protein [Rhizobium]